MNTFKIYNIMKDLYFFKRSNNGLFNNGLPVAKTNKLIEIYRNKIHIKTSVNDVVYENLIEITKEEYDKLLLFWNSLALSKPSEDPTYHCFSEVSKKAKVPVSTSKFRGVFYKQKIKIPELEAYICPKCSKIHLGKINIKNI